MKEKNFKLLILISLIILQVATIANIYGLLINKSAQFAVNLIAIVLEMLYYAVGFKKSGSLFFRGFMGFTAVKEGLALLNMALYETIPASAFLLVLTCYTCAVVLAVCKDLGQKTSYILAGIILVIAILSLAYSTMLTPPSFMAGNIDGDYLFIYNGTRVLLTCELIVMIVAKYKDKRERHTK